MTKRTQTVAQQFTPAAILPSNAPWLIMVYMAGDNNLTEEMVLALQDLMAEGAQKDNVLVAQFDPGGLGIATQRYVFSAAAGAGPVWYLAASPDRPALLQFQDPAFNGVESSTGCKQTLIDFITWARTHVPGASSGQPTPMQTLLILSGHGSGTTEDFFMKDEAAADALTFEELAEVLRWHSGKDGARIDVLGLDACYMCMGELAHEVRDDAGILIGPEGLEPSFGWP